MEVGMGEFDIKWSQMDNFGTQELIVGNLSCAFYISH